MTLITAGKMTGGRRGRALASCSRAVLLAFAVANLWAASARAQVDTTPPADISDLSAAPDVNTSRLTWTAPGDDGIVGTAVSYEIRYSTAVPTVADSFESGVITGWQSGGDAAWSAVNSTHSGTGSFRISTRPVLFLRCS